MVDLNKHIERSKQFSDSIGAENPILLGPMAGACPVSLSVAVAEGGGTGACGALLMQPEAIKQWATDFRAQSDGPFQLNLWIPDASPKRNADHENELRAYLKQWGPEVSADAANSAPPDFEAQCEALLDISPPIISSIMGIFDPDTVARMKSIGIKWFANVSTVNEARLAEAAGADAIIAKGMEGGGHSGAFEPENARRQAVGLFSLVPAVADAVAIPVIAAGGIADSRTALAALMLGASAIQMGTGFLRTPEAGIATAWADAIGSADPEDTIATRAFSGRLGRSIATQYALAMESPNSLKAAPYPIQRGLTQAMRNEAAKTNNLDGMQAWAGQSAKLAQNIPAKILTQNLWNAMTSA